MHQSVHLSIDDVGFLFIDLIANGEQYKSMFQSPLLKFLRNLHHRYNARFTLFGYTNIQNHSITEVPDKFKQEFNENASWLKFGFHWPSDFNGVGYDSVIQNVEIIKASCDFYKSITRFATQENISKYIRLHYFHPSGTLIDKLIFTPWWHDDFILLCADSNDRISYDLSKAETDVLYKLREVIKPRRKYIPTDIRIERFDGNLNPFIHYPLLTIFTHEWAIANNRANRGLKERIYDFLYNINNRRRFKALIKELSKRNCLFIS